MSMRISKQSGTAKGKTGAFSTLCSVLKQNKVILLAVWFFDPSPIYRKNFRYFDQLERKFRGKDMRTGGAKGAPLIH